MSLYDFYADMISFLANIVADWLFTEEKKLRKKTIFSSIALAILTFAILSAIKFPGSDWGCILILGVLFFLKLGFARLIPYLIKLDEERLKRKQDKKK